MHAKVAVASECQSREPTDIRFSMRIAASKRRLPEESPSEGPVSRINRSEPSSAKPRAQMENSDHAVVTAALGDDLVAERLHLVLERDRLRWKRFAST